MVHRHPHVFSVSLFMHVSLCILSPTVEAFLLLIFFPPFFSLSSHGNQMSAAHPESSSVGGFAQSKRRSLNVAQIRTVRSSAY